MDRDIASKPVFYCIRLMTSPSSTTKPVPGYRTSSWWTTSITWCREGTLGLNLLIQKESEAWHWGLGREDACGTWKEAEDECGTTLEEDDIGRPECDCVRVSTCTTSWQHKPSPIPSPCAHRRRPQLQKLLMCCAPNPYALPCCTVIVDRPWFVGLCWVNLYI